MKLLCFILLISFTFHSVSAQQPVEKAVNTINEQNARSIIGFLASDALEGRRAGSNSGKVTAEYLASYLISLGIEPLSDSYFQQFEAYNEDFQSRKRYTVEPDSIVKYKQRVHRVLKMQNVIGMIGGVNPDEYVIVGAHYDHLGKDESLEGDQIYNGADDNASGVSAVMQIAKAFVESGVKPQRNVIFAFWDGEELGLLGSRYFTMSCTFTNDIKGYLNFDMIGRNNDESQPKHVVYFYSEQHPVFGNWLKDSIRKYGLNLEPDYRPSDNLLGGSDNRSFARYDIPVIWYHTDGHPDYHKPSDEASHINWGKLVDITKAAFLNMWNLANEKNY
ncbi:MAG TPA: aminopeptidase [Dysgonomonas sp.]|nr:aminopeptidase [Dysgonomonas sp.]